MRDHQRQRVYDSEVFLRAANFKGNEFDSVAECQAYIDKVLSRKRLINKHRRMKNMTIVARDGRGRSATACADFRDQQRAVCLPRVHRIELTILHEIAHHVAGLNNDHRWQFCATLLDLVREMMGAEAHGALLAQYKQRNVKYREPRTRTMTPEQKKAAAARLVAARAARSGTEGVWAIRNSKTWYLRNLTNKYGSVDFKYSSQVVGAQTWKYRESAQRWVDKLNEIYRSGLTTFEVVDIDA
jgi:putative metallohydrolase (TIGR04338 family)